MHANLYISDPIDLKLAASILSEILNVSFEEDNTGHYDEFPAYVAYHEGSKYALLGPPPVDGDIRDIKSDELQLMIRDSSDTDASRSEDYSHVLARTIAADGRIHVQVA